MSTTLDHREGDEASIAIHTPEREDAFQILESLGWHEIPEPVDAAADEAAPLSPAAEEPAPG